MKKYAETGIQKREARELKRPFGLFQDLVSYAEKKGVEWESVEGDLRRSAPMPEKYRSLLGKEGEWFVTGVADRRSTYYQEGTRTVEVQLASKPSTTDAGVHRQSILFTLPEKRADYLKVRDRESVNDTWYAHGAREGHKTPGKREVIYKLLESGERVPVSLEVDRVDEGVFDLGEGDETIRWNRNLQVENREGGSRHVQYRDEYLFRVDQDIKDRTDGQITTSFKEVDGVPRDIEVRIGFGPEGSVFLNDPERGIRVVATKPVRGDHPYDRLKMDPVYDLLLGDDVDAELYMDMILDRIQTLTEQWDQEETIYGGKPMLDRAAVLEVGKE